MASLDTPFAENTPVVDASVAGAMDPESGRAVLAALVAAPASLSRSTFKLSLLVLKTSDCDVFVENVKVVYVDFDNDIIIVAADVATPLSESMNDLRIAAIEAAKLTGIDAGVFVEPGDGRLLFASSLGLVVTRTTKHVLHLDDEAALAFTRNCLTQVMDTMELTQKGAGSMSGVGQSTISGFVSGEGVSKKMSKSAPATEKVLKLAVFGAVMGCDTAARLKFYYYQGNTPENLAAAGFLTGKAHALYSPGGQGTKRAASDLVGGGGADDGASEAHAMLLGAVSEPTAKKSRKSGTRKAPFKWAKKLSKGVVTMAGTVALLNMSTFSKIKAPFWRTAADPRENEHHEYYIAMGEAAFYENLYKPLVTKWHNDPDVQAAKKAKAASQ
jgi:hypothetical protein